MQSETSPTTEAFFTPVTLFVSSLESKSPTPFAASLNMAGTSCEQEYNTVQQQNRSFMGVEREHTRRIKLYLTSSSAKISSMS